MSWTQISNSCGNAAKACSDMYDSTSSELFQVCARGLEAVCAQPDRYKSNVVVAADFLQELETTAKDICGTSCSDAQAAGFALVELLALVMRETSLRVGSPPTQAEAALLRFFEESGNWEPQDTTLVSDYYYRRIPAALHSPTQGETFSQAGHA